jgi:hypothetical protein
MRRSLIPALVLLVSGLCLGCDALLNPSGLSGYLYLMAHYTDSRRNFDVGVNFRTLGENPVAVTGYKLAVKDASGDDLPYKIDFPPVLADDYYVRQREGIAFTLEVRTLATDGRIPAKVKVTVYFKDRLGYSASVAQSVDIPSQN